jgi:hypothetical protein
MIYNSRKKNTTVLLASFSSSSVSERKLRTHLIKSFTYSAEGIVNLITKQNKTKKKTFVNIFTDTYVTANFVANQCKEPKLYTEFKRVKRVQQPPPD